MTRQSSYSIGAIILFLLSPLFTNSSAHAAVVINELLPKTDPSSYEWIELYNTGSESVYLDRWHLDHTAGDSKSFILPANALIQPHGFLIFLGSQTAISFSVEGDTARLFDANGTLVDSKSYPGTLGYNTSIGRSTDGGDGWVICAPDPLYNATPDKPNNCPPAPTPTPTSTPFPTATSTPTPLPTATPIPTPQPKADRPLADTPARQTFGSMLPSPAEIRILGAADTTFPTPAPDLTHLTLKIDKILTFQIFAVAAAWSVIAVAAYVRRKKRRRLTV